MKTLLINPDSQKIDGIGGQISFPLGLGYIAAMLERKHPVSVIDVGAEGLDDGGLKERIAELGPDVVGITSDSISFRRAIEIAQMVKRIKPTTVVVAGGAHANAWPLYPLHYDYFDASVYGEGEITAVELWDRLERDESLATVKGIAYRDGGKIVSNPRRDFVENLDTLPFPARHLFPMRKYGDGESHLHVTPVIPVGTSRGCPYSCAFCSNNVAFGKKYRFRSAVSVLAEIELLIGQYGAKGIYFREDLFTVNRGRVMELCRGIVASRLRFQWECESRVDTVDAEMLEAMKLAGCRQIWFGVESGCRRILGCLNKRITLEQASEAYRLCKRVGIRAGASFMIGVPGETLEEINQTVEFAKCLKADFTWFNIFTAYPISVLYEEVRRGRFFDREVGHGILVIRTGEFNKERLVEIQQQATKVTINRRRLLRLALLQLAKGRLTPRKVLRGLKYAFR